MFGFMKERRARTVVEQVAPTVVEGVQSMAVLDRAGMLMIVNAMLEVAAENWGSDVLKRPSALPKEKVVEIVVFLADRHVFLLNELSRGLAERGMGDIVFAQAMREARACEVAIATLGVSLLAQKPDTIGRAWKLLWQSRTEASEAAKTLLRFSKHAGADPIPRTGKRRGQIKEDDLIKLANTLPAMFKRKPVLKGKAETRG